jgi:hypothetical protein
MLNKTADDCKVFKGKEVGSLSYILEKEDELIAKNTASL